MAKSTRGMLVVWSNTKKAAKKDYEENLKKFEKESDKSTEDTDEIKAMKNAFKALMKSFDKDFTGQLKSLEGEKDAGNQLRKAADALATAKQYKAQLKKSEYFKPLARTKVIHTLEGGLKQVNTKLKECHVFLTKLMAKK